MHFVQYTSVCIYCKDDTYTSVLICFTRGTARCPYGCSLVSLMPADVVTWLGIDWIYSKEWVELLCLPASSVREGSLLQRAKPMRRTAPQSSFLDALGRPCIEGRLSPNGHRPISLYPAGTFPANQRGATQAQLNCQMGLQKPTFLLRREKFCCMKIEDRKGAFPSTQQSAVGTQEEDTPVCHDCGYQ